MWGIATGMQAGVDTGSGSGCNTHEIKARTTDEWGRSLDSVSLSPSHGDASSIRLLRPRHPSPNLPLRSKNAKTQPERDCLPFAFESLTTCGCPYFGEGLVLCGDVGVWGGVLVKGGGCVFLVHELVGFFFGESAESGFSGLGLVLLGGGMVVFLCVHDECLCGCIIASGSFWFIVVVVVANKGSDIRLVVFSKNGLF